MNDTPPQFEAMVRERIMRRSPADRLRMGCEMFDMAKAIATSALGDLDGVDRRVALFERFYGDDFDELQKESIRAHLRTLHTGPRLGPDRSAPARSSRPATSD